MSTGWPSVRALKRLRSAGRCQGMVLSLPMTRFAASAAMRQMQAVAGDGGAQRCAGLAGSITVVRFAASDSDRRLDRRMRLVALETEILVAKAENVFYRRVEMHQRQWPRRARKLLARLIQVIEVQMRVTQRMHELAWL